MDKVGEVSDQYGSADVLSPTTHTATVNDILQADVTIKNDGDTVGGVVVKPVGRLIPVLSGVCKMWLN